LTPSRRAETAVGREKPPTQRDHVFNQHLEYLTSDSIGQKYLGKGYFLDPGNPDAILGLLSFPA